MTPKAQAEPTAFEAGLETVAARMISALNAYQIWKWLKQATIAHRSEGGKAKTEKRQSVLDRHASFFQQISLSSQKSFVADLSIFFDESLSTEERPTSIYALINLLPDTVPAEERASLQDGVKRIQDSQEETFAFLQTLQHTDAIHQVSAEQKDDVSFEDMDALFVAVQDSLALVAPKHADALAGWSRVESDVRRQMNWIFNNLERGEVQRRLEVKMEHQKAGTEDTDE